MRRNRGRTVDLDMDLDFGQDHELGGRPGRRAKAAGNDLDAARAAWEPIVCPECGTDHPDTLSVRLKRTGREIEARCLDCGTVAARYTSGVWSS